MDEVVAYAMMCGWECVGLDDQCSSKRERESWGPGSQTKKVGTFTKALDGVNKETSTAVLGPCEKE